VRVLVVNAESSSLKVRLLDPDDALLRQLDIPPPRLGEDHVDLIEPLAGVRPVDAVGHRIVHGQRFREAVLVDAGVVAELHAMTDLAPLHQPGGGRVFRDGRSLSASTGRHSADSVSRRAPRSESSVHPACTSGLIEPTLNPAQPRPSPT
jgi:hypothetical protein